MWVKYEKAPLLAVYGWTTEHVISEVTRFDELTRIDYIHLMVADNSPALVTNKRKVFVNVERQPILLQDLYMVLSQQLNVMSCAKLG